MTKPIRSYRDLRIWQYGIELAKEIYQLTAVFPEGERYGLVSQLRRAAVSIPSNIAEGQGRGQPNDFARFLRIALGSPAESDTQLIIAYDLGYISAGELKQVVEKITSIKKMTCTLLNRLAE